jgi:tetratricopeptide (TPR) repeat protein
MDHFGEQPKFEIQPVIEQRPFENPAVQSFFTKWCEINDSIQPQMIGRGEWEKRGIKGVLEKRPDGKQTLFIPEDLQLWEMVGLMEVVDHDTFAAKSERRTEAKEKLLALAKTFQNSGNYVAQRLEGIYEGREIAEALAQEFYEYGQSLVEGKRPETPLSIADIASQNLTPGETETVDRFLAGDTLYESRQKRVEQAITRDPSKKDELYEAERQRTLSQFFRAAERAFALESKSTAGELRKSAVQLKPWQSDAPIHSTFLAKIEKAMTQKIETPKREFEMAVFRRGLEKLTSEMREFGWKHPINSFFENLGLDLQVKQKKLVDALHISELKAELETIRQAGDFAKISQKEREIADRIQSAVAGFPYLADANNPAEMVANQYINCVGASTLGGALMKEAGLNYLVGNLPEHSILFLVTSDGEIEWRDMLNASFNGKLTDEMIEGREKDGAPLTVRDIAAFSHKPTPKGLMFDVKSDRYKKKLSWVKEGQREYVTVFEPEYGQQIQVLNNTGNALSNLGRAEEAIEAYRQAVAVDPKYASPYNGLGNALRSLGRAEEAIEAYRQAIAVDPKYAYPYNGLGNALSDLGRKEEAIEAYRQAVAVDPNYTYPYYGLGIALSNLGRTEEAIEAYRKFIDLADKKNDDYWVKRAERIIAKLKE